MNIEITIPSPGESITEVELARWLAEDGSYVEKDQELAEVESDKATLPLIAEQSGRLKILIQEGELVKVGTVACTIDTAAVNERKTDHAEKKAGKDKKEIRSKESSGLKKSSGKTGVEEIAARREEVFTEEKPEHDIRVTPLARKKMEEQHLNVEDIIGGLKKITTREVEMVARNDKPGKSGFNDNAGREIRKEPMSQLRKKLSARLVTVKNETAMLTTFNEVDMSEVIRLRSKYQKTFSETHEVRLGFMSFFVKACTVALQEFPKVNSMLDGSDVIFPQYVDISIAVQTEKGLMVPVLRNTETMGLADIEKNIIVLAEKARKFRLSIEEMSGGTFSITNGGIFGSMLSTPILNPPQPAILGMHNIVDRPVAINGKVEIRPVMYLALSYDHRLIDGRDSVSFLYRVKELLESPVKMLFGGKDTEKMLLGLG